MAKLLTKIKLINWYSFANETIEIKDGGSSLFIGDNGNGKTVILDAISMMITANTKNFNVAGNDKSTRDLKGYVRFKTGAEEGMYVRSTGPVISYIALEWYEENKDRYFVTGIKIDSPDIDAELSKKWFQVEGKLESLNFFVQTPKGIKPATDKEFTQNGKRVPLEGQTGRAKADLLDRYGHLESKFPDLMLKSMRVGSITNIKAFITNFLLPEVPIDIEQLQNSINSLREMQGLIQQVKARIEVLDNIVAKSNDVADTEDNILIIDLLLKIAEIKAKQDRQEFLKAEQDTNNIILEQLASQENKLEKEIENIEARLQEVKYSIQTNESARLISKLEQDLGNINSQLKEKENNMRSLQAQVRNLIALRNETQQIDLSFAEQFLEARASEKEKTELLAELNKHLPELTRKLYSKQANLNRDKEEQSQSLKDLSEKIKQLERNHRVSYDNNVVALVNAIGSEFKARNIDCKVKVLADMLEITDSKWQNAIEGYLGNRRFNLIVEPRYYKIAAEVYDRMKDKIYDVGLVNAAKLHLDEEAPHGTLAAFVTSENRYAKAYANFILGRVVCCDSVAETDKYDIAITEGCMVYQGYVLRKIPNRIYATPYIGKHAIEIQLKTTKEELEKLNIRIRANETERKHIDTLIELVSKCDLNSLKEKLTTPEDIKALLSSKTKTAEELKKANSNPDLLSLNEIKSNHTKKLEEKKKSSRCRKRTAYQQKTR